MSVFCFLGQLTDLIGLQSLTALLHVSGLELLVLLGAIRIHAGQAIFPQNIGHILVFVEVEFWKDRLEGLVLHS